MFPTDVRIYSVFRFHHLFAIVRCTHICVRDCKKSDETRQTNARVYQRIKSAYDVPSTDPLFLINGVI